MNRVLILKILEYTWLVVGIVCMFMSAYSYNRGDIHETLMFLLFTVVGGCLFMFRRQQRKVAEKDGE